MEPKLPSPNLGPEHQPGGYGQNERIIPQPPTPEDIFERRENQFEQRMERPAGEAIAQQPTLPPPVVVLPTPTVDGGVTSVPVSDDLPLVANDDDLIEKEWVDKAKKIIIQTKDDPYRREQEVGKLQADYLRKRYGKELGAPE